MSDPRTIRIITAAEQPEPSDGKRGVLQDVGENFGLAAKTATEVAAKTLKRGTEIPIDTLKAQMLKVHGVMTEIFEQFEMQDAQKPSGLHLDEVELSIEIDSRGEVSIMGVGGTEVGGKGAITLKFKRPGLGD